jgi:hypothetical protein
MYKKKIKMIILILLIILLVVFVYLFVGYPKPKQDIVWGVNFSQKHTENLKLDWKEAYIAILDDLGVRNLKVSASWDFIEGEKDDYFFNDLDWQVKEAEKRKAKIIMVMGMKTLGWPECHLPEWTKGLEKEKQQEQILQLLEQIVLRYKNSKAIEYWQVENEPFFPFGNCPWQDSEFLKKEIEFVKSLDSSREIIITESGEFPFWFSAAKYGDIVGVTTYRKVWMNETRSYFIYPFTATFYRRKADLINFLFHKNVIGVELQAEPWGPKLIYDLSLEEQSKSMDLERFKKNIEFAKKVGFDRFYLWGAEWMYWMKAVNNDSQIWEEAKSLFK